MKVYIGYDCYDNGCDIWKTVVKVFDDEVKALIWKETQPDNYNPSEWREYSEVEVE
jgi:hypothetical protein